MALWTDLISPAELTGFARAAVEDVERQKGTLARWLQDQPQVVRVLHPALPGIQSLLPYLNDYWSDQVTTRGMTDLISQSYPPSWCAPSLPRTETVPWRSSGHSMPRPLLGPAAAEPARCSSCCR